MGGKSKKQSNYSTVGPPEYIDTAYRNLVSQVQDTAAKPYKAYTGQLVAGLTPEQEAGIAGITNAQGVGNPYYDKAAGYFDQGAATISPTAFSSEALEQYLNPYRSQVIDATMAQTAENDRRQQQDLTGNAIISGAWGGDRAGVAKAELARQQKLAADQTLAGLNSQSYDQALKAFQQQQGVDLGARQSDAARAAAAGSSFAGLGTAKQESSLKDALAMLQAGGVRQQNQQAGLTSNYQQFLDEQAYPFMSQGWLANLLTGIGSSAGSNSTGFSKGSGDSGLGSILGGGISLISTLMSDERVKEDVEQVGETYDGQPIYRYRYIGDPRMQIGLMAQDVEQENPDAVGEFGGIKRVDYERATDDAARYAGGIDPGREQFAEGGVTGIPYSSRAKGRIPDLQPIKGRTGLMQPPSAPSLGSDQKGGGQDLGKLGGQLGGLINKGVSMFGGAQDISPIGFNPSAVGDVSGGLSGIGSLIPIFSRGGAVDMEEGADGSWRPAFAFGGEIDFFDPEPMGGTFERAEPRPEQPEPKAQPEFEPDMRGGPGGFSPGDVDAIVRTVYGEAAKESPEGQRAVAEVIRNRAMQGNMTPTDVVLAPNQFEPWGSRRAELQNLDPNSPTYKAILANVMPVIQGTAPDVTDQADHFYAPRAQAALGRNAPKWDDGTGVDVGNHRFFEHGYGGGPASPGVAVARSPANPSSSGVARATAFAPTERRGVATDAFDAVKPAQNVPLSGGVVPAPKREDAEKGFGLGFIPKDIQLALIAAGLGMMASRGRSGGQQIGEGALTGLQTYLSSQESKRKSAVDERDLARKTVLEDRDYGLRSRSADISEKSLLQRAEEARERLGLSKRQVDVMERSSRATGVPTGFERTDDGSVRPIPGGPADPDYIAKQSKAKGEGKNKPLPQNAITALTDAGAKAADFRRLTDTFNPDYSGKMFDVVGEGQNWVGRTVGAGYGNQAQWWQDYQEQKNLIRNQLFGSALTATEKAEFDKANIAPGMSPETIAANLARQKAATMTAAKKLAGTYIAQGFDPNVIETAIGFPLKELGLNADGEKAAGKTGDAPAKITSKAQFDALKPGTKFIDPNGDVRIKPEMKADGGAAGGEGNGSGNGDNGISFAEQPPNPNDLPAIAREPGSTMPGLTTAIPYSAKTGDITAPIARAPAMIPYAG